MIGLTTLSFLYPTTMDEDFCLNNLFVITQEDIDRVTLMKRFAYLPIELKVYIYDFYISNWIRDKLRYLMNLHRHSTREETEKLRDVWRAMETYAPQYKRFVSRVCRSYRNVDRRCLQYYHDFDLIRATLGFSKTIWYGYIKPPRLDGRIDYGEYIEQYLKDADAEYIYLTETKKLRQLFCVYTLHDTPILEMLMMFMTNYYPYLRIDWCACSQKDKDHRRSDWYDKSERYLYDCDLDNPNGFVWRDKKKRRTTYHLYPL